MEEPSSDIANHSTGDIMGTRPTDEVIKNVVSYWPVSSDQYDENVVDRDNVEMVETHMDCILGDLTIEAKGGFITSKDFIKAQVSQLHVLGLATAIFNVYDQIVRSNLHHPTVVCCGHEVVEEAIRD